MRAKRVVYSDTPMYSAVCSDADRFPARSVRKKRTALWLWKSGGQDVVTRDPFLEGEILRTVSVCFLNYFSEN